MNKSIPKFKKGDIAYFFNQSTMPNIFSVMHNLSLLMVSAWIIKVDEVKGTQVKGHTLRTWIDVKHLNRNYLKSQLVKPIKDWDKMKDTELVKLRFDGTTKNLLTREELKMEMIKWIANDFDDPTEHDYNDN